MNFQRGITQISSFFNRLPRQLVCASVILHQPNASLTNNQQIVPLANFVNKNPRNLERLAIAEKDQGWGNGTSHESTNHPSRSYYHRVYMDKSEKYVTLSIEHSTGKVVVEASSKEKLIREKLFSGSDVCASENVARVLAERCLRSGITCVHWPRDEEAEGSQSLKVARDTMLECGVALEEPSTRHLQYCRPHWKPRGPAPVELEGVEPPITPRQISTD